MSAMIYAFPKKTNEPLRASADPRDYSYRLSPQMSTFGKALKLICTTIVIGTFMVALVMFCMVL